MANFDFQSLLQNPMFQSGLGIFGASSPKNSPLMSAYQILAAQSNAAAERKREESKQKLEEERARLYGEQIKVSQANAAREAKIMEMLDPITRALAEKYGIAAVTGGMAGPGQGSKLDAGVTPVAPQAPMQNFSLPMPGQMQPPPGAGIPMPAQPQAAPQAGPQIPDLFGGAQDMQAIGGITSILNKDYGAGFKGLAEAVSPREVKPDTTYQLPGGRTVTTPQSTTQKIDLDLRSKSEQRQQRKLDVETNAQFAKDKAAYEMVTSAADRMDAQVEKLLGHKGRESATGFSGLANIAALPGGDRKQFLIELKSLTSQLVNDTLQSVRTASANGASGYGQFTEKELGIIQTYVANLDPLGDEKEFVKNLEKVQAYAKDIRKRAATLYEGSTGKPVPEKKIEKLPEGAKLLGTKNGKKVYQLPNGSRIIED